MSVAAQRTAARAAGLLVGVKFYGTVPAPLDKGCPPSVAAELRRVTETVCPAQAELPAVPLKSGQSWVFQSHPWFLCEPCL